MHKWQSVYEYRHVVAVGSQSVLYFILVDYLCVVVVNVIFVYELYVALLPIVERQCLDVVLLYGLRFLGDAVAFIGYLTLKEALPFRIGESVVVEPFELFAQIGNQLTFMLDRHVFVALSLELFYHLALQVGLTLIECFAHHSSAFIVRHHRALVVLG